MVKSRNILSRPAKSTLRKTLKTVPNIGSKEFPKVFTLAGSLVGFQYSSSRHSAGLFNISLFPVGRKPENWKPFDIGTKGVFFQNSGSKQSGLKRPRLARGQLVAWGKYELNEAPPEIKKIISAGKLSKVREVRYGIENPYQNPRGKSSLLFRGIGTAIIKELELHAKKEGVSVLTAVVDDSNTASRSLLEKNGFVRSKDPSHKINWHTPVTKYYYYKKI